MDPETGKDNFYRNRTSQDVSAEILKFVRETAAAKLDCDKEDLKNVVITYPAFFEQGQRDITKNAGL